MLTLVDTNVLIDVGTEDPAWFTWSAAHLERVLDAGGLAINPIISAKLSVHYETVEALDEALSGFKFERLQLPWEAAFVAGKAYRRYRRRGGAQLALRYASEEEIRWSRFYWDCSALLSARAHLWRPYGFRQVLRQSETDCVS